MADEIEVISSAQRLAPGDCEGTPGPPATDTWGTLSTHHGVLLCYAAADALRLAWTYDADRIVARAARSGDATGSQSSRDPGPPPDNPSPETCLMKRETPEIR